MRSAFTGSWCRWILQKSAPVDKHRQIFNTLGLIEKNIWVGLFGIGLDTYWEQFEGLLDRLIGYQSAICDRLQEHGCQVVNAGMIDNPSKVSAAVELFQRERIEILFLYVSTYALSSTVLPVAQKAKFIFEENKYSFIAMETVAQSLGLDYQLFRRIFKDYTGLPPYQYFLQIKINKAKTLLREQRYTVKEVAHMLAFENQYYFSRLFKRKTGIAPSMWQSERAIWGGLRVEDGFVITDSGAERLNQTPYKIQK